MSRDQLDHLLQECLAGYDAGLSPEECLSAYPYARDQLEPLLRQALQLRVAFAASPSEEFRLSTREKLLFTAGRDVRVALAGEPDPAFVTSARSRLLRAAGATAQEALRDIPPPRLPFWVNARRRLLEAAAMSRPAPTYRPMGFGLRSALSAAVVVLAVTVAALGFVVTGDPPGLGTRSANANLEYLDQQIAALERQRALGQPLSSSVLGEVTTMTSQLAEQISKESSGPLAAKLQPLIERQQIVVQEAIEDGQAEPELAETLSDAETKLAAARTETPTAQPTTSTALNNQATSTATPRATTTPTPEPTAEPTATIVVPRVDQDDLTSNQIAIQVRPSYDAFDGSNDWIGVTTKTIDFVIPPEWTVRDYKVNSRGIAVLNGKYIFIETDGEQTDGEKVLIIVNSENGEVNALYDGKQISLREEGPDGDVIGQLYAFEEFGELGLYLHHFAESVELSDD